jgi:ketosteroid isomerase-like protein
MATAVQTRSTTEVIQAHLQARHAGQIDAVLQDYAPQAMVISPLGIYRGTERIRRFAATLTEILPPGCEFNLEKEIIEGEVGYLVWQGESRLCRFPYVGETLVVRDGLIQAHTLAGIIEDKE